MLHRVIEINERVLSKNNVYKKEHSLLLLLRSIFIMGIMEISKALRRKKR